MVRSTVRRAAALAGTGALAVLACAGPALAADVAPGAPAPAQQVQAQVGVPDSAPAPAPGKDQQQTQPGSQSPQGQPAAPDSDGGKTYVIWCHHHHEGLLSGVLEGVGDILGALL